MARSNDMSAPQRTRFVTSPGDSQVLKTNSVGGSGGNGFSFFDPAGISQLTVVPITFEGTTYMTQITVVGSDGTVSQTFGTIEEGSGPAVTLQLATDSLKTCQLYGVTLPDGTGRVAGLKIQTVNGQNFVAAGTVGLQPTDLTVGDNLDVENYYIAGVYGCSGTNVDSLGFYVVEDPIVRRVVQDFNYTLPGTAPTTPVTLNTLVVENKSSEQQTSEISFTEDISSTSEWSSTAGITLGVETQITTGIPIVAEGTVKLTVTASYEYSWGGSLTTSHQFSYAANVDVPTQAAVSASVVVLQAPLSIAFTATYLVERAHAGINSMQIAGTYNGVSTYDVSVVYADQPLGAPIRPATVPLMR